VYQLQGHGRNWVIKHFRATGGDGLYPILPQAEALALQTLSGLGIAPEPIAFFEDVPLLVYQFVAGQAWQDDIAAVGRLLYRLHTIPIPAEANFRHLLIEPAQILQQGDHLLAQAQADSLVRQLRAARPQPQPLPPLSQRSLVHTDAWIGNFIQSDTDLWLIDWQCPGLGDPAEDVWTFLHAGYEMLLGRPRFDEAARAEFWRGYGDTAVYHRLQPLAPYYAYRVAAHCCLRQQQLASTNPSASATYQQLFQGLLSQLS
jgi:aminoglycoside phosphotransferase (APT) family kinase protein